MGTRARVSAIVAMLVVLAACGDSPAPPDTDGGTPAAKTEVETPDTPAATMDAPAAKPDAPDAPGTVAPEVTPPHIAFGEVPRGRVVSRAVDVRSASDGFAITRVAVKPAHLATATVTPLGDALQRVTVALKEGWAATAIDATLEIHTNDPAHPTLTVAIKGTPVEPPKKQKPRASPF